MLPGRHDVTHVAEELIESHSVVYRCAPSSPSCISLAFVSFRTSLCVCLLVCIALCLSTGRLHHTSRRIQQAARHTGPYAYARLARLSWQYLSLSTAGVSSRLRRLSGQLYATRPSFRFSCFVYSYTYLYICLCLSLHALCHPFSTFLVSFCPVSIRASRHAVTTHSNLHFAHGGIAVRANAAIGLLRTAAC